MVIWGPRKTPFSIFGRQNGMEWHQQVVIGARIRRYQFFNQRQNCLNGTKWLSSKVIIDADDIGACIVFRAHAQAINKSIPQIVMQTQ